MGGRMVGQARAALCFLLLVLALLTAAEWNYAQAQDGGAELFIELDDPDAKPVVGEMVLLTIRGVYDVVITLEKMELPRVEGFDWVQIENDAWTREQVDGKEKAVMRRRLALFAKQEGELTIGPFVHRLTVQPRAGGRIKMDVEAEAVTLAVGPYPGGKDAWPFSAKLLEYSDDWSDDPSTLKDGDTVKRTVSLMALGVLPELFPPQPQMRAYWLITFSPPEERKLILTENGPITQVIWSWEMRPITGEPGVIREYKIPWLNTKTRQMEMIELAPAPFGYASFAENKNALALTSVDQRPVLALITLAGLGVSGIALFAGLRIGPVGRLEVWRHGAVRWNARLSMFRAALVRDPIAMRIATDRLLAADPTPPTAEGRMAIQSLDHLLFSRSGASDSFDFFTYLRCFWRPLN